MRQNYFDETKVEDLETGDPVVVETRDEVYVGRLESCPWVSGDRHLTLMDEVLGRQHSYLRVPNEEDSLKMGNDVEAVYQLQDEDFKRSFKTGSLEEAKRRLEP